MAVDEQSDQIDIFPCWTCSFATGTVKRLILVANNFGDFKSLTYWRSLTLAVY